jgi:ribosomal protein S18 acetylase RimI-like enzyme
LHRDNAALLVAEDDGTLIGTVIAAWDGWRGSIYRLVVIPSERGRGLGRRLLAEGERRLEAVGARRLQAIVVETDARAMGFWWTTGWQEQNERRRFVRG